MASKVRLAIVYVTILVIVKSFLNDKTIRTIVEITSLRSNCLVGLGLALT